MIVYDCEIIKAIQGKNEERLPGIEYCKGWRDFNGMGISTIATYSYVDDRYRVFCKDNFDEFQALVDASEIIVGYNSLSFDNRLCDANEITVPEERSYDLLVEIWAAVGLGPRFAYPTHVGYGLEAVAWANLGERKSGHGSLAPVKWQRGEIGSVIDYNLQDVRLTKRLLDLVMEQGFLNNPTAGTMAVRSPQAVEA